MLKKGVLTILTFLLLSTYADAKERSAVSGMKCGAGKCGANMIDGNAALSKKKRNILSQMREGDTRKDCVIQAATTKAVYDCVRDPKSKKLTTRCGAGKCGSKRESEATPAMKCGADKCGGR